MNGFDVRLAAIGTALQAILAALVLLDVISLTDQQLAGIMVAANAVIAAVIVWLSPYVPSTPTEGNPPSDG
jgi:hypothetical protein